MNIEILLGGLVGLSLIAVLIHLLTPSYTSANRTRDTESARDARTEGEEPDTSDHS